MTETATEHFPGKHPEIFPYHRCCAVCSPMCVAFAMKVEVLTKALARSVTRTLLKVF